jgi:pimeloyl-ACP methyl ester carboxylesterase
MGDELREATRRTSDGAEIRYRVRPGRDPWVLLHALGCDSTLWDDVIARFPVDVGLLVPDLRGHGGSTLGWRAPSIDLWAEDVSSLTAYEGMNRPAIAGLSMGGYITMACAVHSPNLARAYGFVSTRAGADDEAGQLGRAEGLATLQRNGWQAFAESLVPRLLSESNPRFEEHRTRLLGMFERAGEVGLTCALFALANRPDRHPLLGEIRVPCVVISGDADLLTPPAVTQRIADAIPDCPVHTLSGVAHLSALEAPEQVARHLLSLD